MFHSQDKVDPEIKTLLALKAEFKSASGKDWKPGMEIPSKAPAPSPASSGGNMGELNNKIVAQGDVVRKLKSEKATKVTRIYIMNLMVSIVVKKNNTQKNKTKLRENFFVSPLISIINRYFLQNFFNLIIQGIFQITLFVFNCNS